MQDIIRGGLSPPFAAHGPLQHGSFFYRKERIWTQQPFSAGIVYSILKGLPPDSAATTVEALSNLASYEKCNPAERFVFQTIVDGLVQAPQPPRKKFSVIKGGVA